MIADVWDEGLELDDYIVLYKKEVGYWYWEIVAESFTNLGDAKRRYDELKKKIRKDHKNTVRLIFPIDYVEEKKE